MVLRFEDFTFEGNLRIDSTCRSRGDRPDIFEWLMRCNEFREFSILPFTSGILDAARLPGEPHKGMQHTQADAVPLK
jgi:hypothetical protein